MSLLHELPDFADLVAVTGRAIGVDPGLVEKDYWIMHALWGLQQGGRTFKLKGGTSLSKGLGLIRRFSEDIDIWIEPQGGLPTGRNHTKPQHIAAREKYYDDLAAGIQIPGFVSVERDRAFDDKLFRSGGIRLNYAQTAPLPGGIKTGILLEAGFDQVAPNRDCDISSWAYDRAVESGLEGLVDNRAIEVSCYEPGYTLVEKLQTVSTKFRHQQASGEMPQNFMRHYYDIYCLLEDATVQAFIGSDAYQEHKARRFPKADEPDLTKNDAFVLGDPTTRALFEAAYVGTSALYYWGQPAFGEVMARIQANAGRL
jgi:hypothetical protein